MPSPSFDREAVEAEIDRKNGEIRLMRFREVKDPVENEATQIPLGAPALLAMFVLSLQRSNPDAACEEKMPFPTEAPTMAPARAEP